MTETKVFMYGSNGKKFKVQKTDEEVINEIRMYSEYAQKLAGIDYIIKFAHQLNKHFLDHLKEVTDEKMNMAIEIRNVYRNEAIAREIKYGFVQDDLLRDVIEMIERVNRFKDYKVEIVFEKNKPQKFNDVSTKELINNYINMVVFMSAALDHAGLDVMSWPESEMLRAIYFVWMEMRHRDVGYKCHLN